MPWFTKIAARLLATVLGIGALSACSVNLSLPSNTTSDNNASQQKKVDTSEDSTKEKSQNSQEESTEKPADLTGTWKTDANEGSDLIAKITNDTITVTWAQPQASEESSLYWKGTLRLQQQLVITHGPRKQIAMPWAKQLDWQHKNQRRNLLIAMVRFHLM